MSTEKCFHNMKYLHHPKDGEDPPSTKVLIDPDKKYVWRIFERYECHFWTIWSQSPTLVFAPGYSQCVMSIKRNPLSVFVKHIWSESVETIQPHPDVKVILLHLKTCKVSCLRTNLNLLRPQCLTRRNTWKRKRRSKSPVFLTKRSNKSVRSQASKSVARVQCLSRN